MRPPSQIDIAPTIARQLGLTIPEPDGVPIPSLDGWRCKNSILAIIDSLGYDLYRWLEPMLSSMPLITASGGLYGASSVSNHTSSAIASILSGLLPVHHRIYDTESAKRSPIVSIPEIASSAGLRSAIVMEKGGAEVYEGLIEYIGAVPRTISPQEFDRQISRLSLEALSTSPRLLVTYFIGLDKAAHNGLDKRGFMDAAIAIDGYIGEIACAAQPGTMIILVGDHPVHAGELKRTQEPYRVALIIGRI